LPAPRRPFDGAPARRPLGARLAATIAGFGALAAGAALLAPLVGSTAIDLRAVFDPSTPLADNLDAQIFFIARLPRVLAAAVVGASLALSGTVLQALLRNPLAAPDTLGVSAGAALGATLVITFEADFSLFGISALPLASFAGALGALAVVYILSAARQRGTSTMVLLLGGVTLTALLSAVMAFVRYLADFTQTFMTVRWLMGSLDVASYAPILAALVPLALALAGFATLPRVLDLLSVGSDAAAARGVDVARAERIALVSTSLATGAAVSLAGPVTFVGIVVPHLVRLVVGADHRLVMPAAGLFGAAFLISCDLIARTIAPPLELPVGVVTALVGGPVFLWLLFTRT
jgi:iron complex transport system permease protein